MKMDEWDRRIIDAVGSLEADLPVSTEQKARERIASISTRTPAWGWSQVWAAVAAAVLIGLFILLPLRQSRPLPEKKITQIRSEFSIPEKNIRIIWVQRDDFRLSGYPE